MQRDILGDAQMIEMLQHGPPDPGLTQAWMRGYGLFQGIKAQDRVSIVNRFLAFAADHERNSDPTTTEEIETLYTALFGSLYRTVPRSWASATSKLLWCLYPKSVVIYDAFVHRVLVAMQCIDADLEGFPRIGAAPNIKNEADIALAVRHYMNYQAMVHRLLSVHAQLLSELRTRHNESYPYDIRILDKILWMIGNPRESYVAEAQIEY